MPEAAEVEVAARQLGELATGRTLRSLVVTHPRTSRAQPADALRMFEARTICRVRRHGKWLILEFTGVEAALGVHLRMSGQLLAKHSGDVPADRHVHGVLDLGAGDMVWFRDPRTFGELRLLDGGVAPVAPDLYDAQVSREGLRAHAERRTVGVKAVLLDQLGIVSGIGSYLADEGLHRVGIAPTRPSNELSSDDWSGLLTAVRSIASESADAGGVTLADEGWVDLYGRPGRYASSLRVHARAACGTCGAPTARAVVGGRGARWCPSCQP